MPSMKLRTTMKPSADSVIACASHVVGTEGAAGSLPVEPVYSESRTCRRRRVPFTSENVIKVVARETGTKESDLEAEETETGTCFEVRAIGESDLMVWVLRDRSCAERRAMELVLDDLCEGIDVVTNRFGEESVFDALLKESRLSDLRPWITSKVRTSYQGRGWRTVKSFWRDWRSCGLKPVTRRTPGSGISKPSRKEHLRLQWAMLEQDIDEIMSGRKQIVDFLSEESGDWERMCRLLSQQCRFDRDRFARRIMEAVGGPGEVFKFQETPEGFMLEGM
jgi:hypothetical protein